MRAGERRLLPWRARSHRALWFHVSAPLSTRATGASFVHLRETIPPGSRPRFGLRRATTCASHE